jgi:hypothetical protein
MTTTDELRQAREARDQELAALRQQIDSLQQQLLAHGIRPRDWPDPFDPDDAQYDELLRIVQQLYPALVPKLGDSPRGDQEANYRKQFTGAMRYLFQARRSDIGKLATGYAASYWTDAAGEYARTGISLKAFCSAVVAVGDVNYAKFDNFPYDLAFGLSLGARSERADPAAGWKRVLAGQLVAPTALATPTAGMSGPQELVVVGAKDFRSLNAWWR